MKLLLTGSFEIADTSRNALQCRHRKCSILVLAMIGRHLGEQLWKYSVASASGWRRAERIFHRRHDSSAVAAFVVLAAGWFGLLFFPGSLRASDRQALHGHVPDVLSHIQPLERLPAARRLNLAISLPLRNQEGLTELLQQIYDPASPNYRKYLTPSQFTAQFGPSERDYQAVIDFARAHGLTVTARHPNRMILDVEGAASGIEKAFNVKLHVYQHPTEKRTFYAPDSEPSLDLAVSVLHVSGLDNYQLPHPHLKRRALNATANAAPNSGGSGPFGCYMGNDFRAAYVPGTTLTGSGQKVGLLQFDGYTTSDITYYESKAGRPNVTLTNVLLDGFNGKPTMTGGEVEVSLDIEMVISMDPGISDIIVYEAGPNGLWHDILNRMADDNLAKQMSCSWYIPGGTMDTTADQIFKQMAAQGQSFFSASGDYDAFTGLIPFPGDTPYITEVGGTTLTTKGAGGAWSSETVWNWGDGIGSGGGISTQYPIPTWQKGISMTANKGSTTMRNVPDVALTADNVYVRVDGSDNDVGGTSCASPLWAGFTALVNQQAMSTSGTTIGFINPAAYAIGTGTNYTVDFHDITTGNNFSTSSPTKFPAVTGYDLCIGWGSPMGAALINALIGSAGVSDNLQISGSAFSSAGKPGGPFAPDVNYYTLKNISGEVLTWSARTNQNWDSISPPTEDKLSAKDSTVVIVSINTNANSLATGTYTDTITFDDLGTGVKQSFPITLEISQPNPVLSLSPATGYFPSGKAGGPFAPSSGTYAMTNTGNSSMSWTVSSTSSWLTVSPGTGTLAAGGTASITASLTSAASGLATGTYADTIVFTNISNGAGNVTEPALLTVLARPAITSATNASAVTGQAFSYQITASNSPVSFNALNLPAWLGIDTTAGLISGTPTGTGTSTVTVSASNAAGTGTATLTIVVCDPTVASDPFAGYSPTSNPAAGGLWQYGYATSLGGGFNLYTVSGTDPTGTTSYWTTGSSNPPNLVKNLSGTDWMDSNNVLYPGADYLNLNPGPAGQYSVVRWTAPATGTYQLAAAFESLRVAGTPTNTNVHVLHNSVSIFDGTINSLLPLSNQTFTMSLPVNTGDTIDFVVGLGSGGNASDASTGLKVVIVPFGTSIQLKTGLASGITASSATLEGTVNLSGSTGSAYFQFGTTTSYGSTTDSQAMSGTANVAVSGSAGGLTLNTLYHYRVVAVTVSGTGYGVDQTFTTIVPGAASDLFKDFSVNINPGSSGTWQYGWTPTPGGTFNLYSISGSTGAGNIISYWIQTTSSVLGVDINTSGTDYINSLSVLYPGSNFVNTTPGPSGEDSVARWTAPVSGIYQIGATFESLETGAHLATTDVHLLKNGSSIFKGTINSCQPWSDQIFTRNVTLDAGDTIDFAVGYGTNLNNYYDSTGVRGTITQIATPGLAVVPSTGFASSGTLGGPFLPVNQSYTLANQELASITWMASNGSSWLTLSQTSGTLASGSSIILNAGINSNANSLSSGSYSDTITFLNVSDGLGTISLPVTLTVQPLVPPVITSATSVTATQGALLNYQITATNGPIISFGAHGLPSGLNVNTLSGLISGTPATAGTFNPTISAINISGTGSAILNITINSPYVLWQNQAFTAAQLLTPAIIGDTADPAGDGIPNLMKYALGLQPNVAYSATSPGMPQPGITTTAPDLKVNASITNQYLTLTFTGTATDVGYSVQATSDLTGAWNTLNYWSAGNPPGTVTVSDTIPISSASKRFMRLQVTGP